MRTQRVVIHDKDPILEPQFMTRPLNRAVLGVAGLSLLIQIAGLVQVLVGMGLPAGVFDHAQFAIVAFLWLALGVFVFLQRRARLSGRLFLLSASAGAAFLGMGTLYYKTSMVDSVIYAAGLLFFAPLLFSFSRAFHEGRPWRRRELLLYVPALVFVWPSAVHLYSGQESVIWRIATLTVAFFLGGAIAQAVFDLGSDRSPEQSAQTRALLFGLVAGTVPAIFTFFVPLASQGATSVPPTWIPPLVLLFLFAMSYAVLLFEFNEADLIVRRGVVYGVLTLVIVVAYGVLGVTLLASRASVTAPAGGLSFVAVTVLIGAAFTPITRSARRLVDWVLYGRKTDRWELLQGLSSRLSTVMQPEELGDALVQEITHALHLRGAFLLRRIDRTFVVRHQVQDESSRRRHEIPRSLALQVATVQRAVGDPPASLLLVHAKPLTAARRQTVPERYKILDDLGIALTIPLVTRSGFEAVLCLQPKLAHDAFDGDDLELLTPVIHQAAAALDNALLFSRLEEKVDELRRAYMRIAREQEAERARLARELHDGTAQELAGLITLATVVERQMNGSDGAARATLDRLRRQAEDAYQGVRRASHALRPLMLDDFGLVPTLARYLDQFQHATGIEVDYSADELEALPDDVELALFRVAQECMENVRKHSGSQEAHLRLRRENGHVTLTVADLGRGMTAPQEHGIGLAGMRERVEAVGGNIRVQSDPGAGVRVEVEIPVGNGT